MCWRVPSASSLTQLTQPSSPCAHALSPCSYGGVVYRENVAQQSDWYVFSIDQITAALQHEGQPS